MTPTREAGQSRPVVAVIGGSSGIGLGVAREMLRCGADVVLVGRSPERLEQAAASIGHAGQVRTATADVADEDQVRALFAEIGDLDHVVLTAADVAYGPLGDLALADIHRVIDSKLVGAILAAKHAAPKLHHRRGSITFTGGIAADRPSPGGATVAAVNSALIGLTRALALELAPIRVNLLAPGWVDTPLWDAVFGADKAAMLAAMAERLPAGRVGTPEDVAQAAVFATATPFLTGAVIPIDGGHRFA